MQMNQVQQGLDRVEQCADEAVSAMRGAQAPDELRECVDEMHRQAREARNLTQQQQQSLDESQVRSRVDELEEAGDRAVQACRSAGSGVDQQLQSAVQRAHDEISSLQKQMQ